MRWYSRISLGLSLAVASAFLVAYWRSLVSHSYPNMNAPGLIAYLLVFLPAPCCCIPLRWHSCSSSESWEALAKERCNGRSTWRCGWRRFVSYLPVFNQALAGV